MSSMKRAACPDAGSRGGGACCPLMSGVDLLATNHWAAAESTKREARRDGQRVNHQSPAIIMEQAQANSDYAVGSARHCPRCGQEGRSVSSLTIQSLVPASAQAGLRSLEGFRFCATATCNVAYFHSASGDILTCVEVGKTIFQKDTDPERLVCYCFQHTVAAIQREFRNTGSSHIATEIKIKCARGLDDCERNNPQGACCLGNVQRVIREVIGNDQPPLSDPGGFCCH